MPPVKKKKAVRKTERSIKVTDALPKTSLSPSLAAISKKYGTKLSVKSSKTSNKPKLKVKVVQSKKKNADITGIQKRTEIWSGNKLIGTQG